MEPLQRPLTAPEPPCTIHYFTLAKTSASDPVSTLFALPSALKDKKSRGSDCLTTGEPRRSKLLRSKELCHSASLSCPPIIRQAFDQYSPGRLFQEGIVEWHRRSTMVRCADKTA